MSRKHKRLPLYENVEIQDIGAEGKAIAKVNEKVVFVKQVVPGDVMDIQIKRKRKKFMEGVPVRFHKYSELRTTPFCKHFEFCGGCKWQNLPYQSQLKYKQKQVKDSLERIAKVELPEIKEILPSEITRFYRNKLEFTFSNKRWLSKEEINSEETINARDALGFHVAGLFDKVLDVQECHLQPDPSNAIRNEIRDYAIANQMSFFDLREQHGMLRTLMIRTSNTGEVMVLLAFFEDTEDDRVMLLNHIKEKFPGMTSLLYTINTKGNDTIWDLDIHTYAGRDYILEEMDGLRFKVGPKSFYQTNAQQALALYRITKELADLKGDEVVYDLYCGTGTIANFVAGACKKVVGIESVDEAVCAARENAGLNGIENAVFITGDMRDIMKSSVSEEYGKPDVIILDPPRAGMHPDVVNAIQELQAERVVYVSCNPATQARDLQVLDNAYEVTYVQPVDMFPHTHHVENIVLLTQRK